jgi:hypothetical protein
VRLSKSFIFILTFVTLAILFEVCPLAVLTYAQEEQKSKSHSPVVELFAQFRDAKGAQPGAGFLDKIHSDGKGAYYSDPGNVHPNKVLLSESTGRLIMEIRPSESVDRQVVFEFDQPTRYVDLDHLLCRSYHPKGPQNVGFTAPMYLKDHPANPSPTDRVFTHIMTTYELRLQPETDANGDTQFRWVSTGHLLNLATMPAGPESRAHVGLVVLYLTVGHVGGYFLNFNNNDTGEMSRTGIVEVTHPGDRTWVLKPLPVGQADAPITMLAANEVRRRVVVYSAAPQERGWCDMGDWMMPFELTLTRRY